MGAITSRQNAAIEEADNSSNNSYKYPPKAGNYFGCHFIMGGEKFDTPQPEAYLFGENSDLNFLGSRPAAFPYPPPQANEITKTLKSLVNIRKESVKFVKSTHNPTKLHSNGATTAKTGNPFNIEFTFDADAKCRITIYYFCTEEVCGSGQAYVSRDSTLNSETFHYDRGASQTFSQTSHVFNPTQFSDEDLIYNSEKDVLPVVIHCVVDEGGEPRQSHTTICVIDRHPDGSYALRALKQKIFIDGLSYLLQEIYGIENKNINRPTIDEETEDNGSECVICMCDTRDTLILPCRHLCLCNSCADSLRYQANNCPICRAPFRALLQIRAIQKGVAENDNMNPSNQHECGNENIPDGYVAVSLIEALNGPLGPSRSAKQSDDGSYTTEETPSEIVVRKNDKNEQKISSKEQLNTAKDNKANPNTPEFRISVLLKDHNGVTKELLNKHSPLLNRAPASQDKNPREKGSLRPQSPRDSVKVVNEKFLQNEESKENNDMDDDSETEKLSPLLNSKMVQSPTQELSTALQMDEVDESIDDTDDNDWDEDGSKQNKRPTSMECSNRNNNMNIAIAEDSDYYTPEDPPQTTILSPVEKKTDKTSLCDEPAKNEISEEKDPQPKYISLEIRTLQIVPSPDC